MPCIAPIQGHRNISVSVRCRGPCRSTPVCIAGRFGSPRHQAGGLTRRFGGGLHRRQRRVGDLAGRLTGAAFGGLGLLGPQLGLPGQELGLLALLPGFGPPLLRLVLLGLLGLGEARLHLLGDVLHLLLAQRPLHRRQQLALVIARVLPEGLLQVLQPLGEALVVLRQRIELGELRPQLLVVLDRVGDEVLGLGVPPEDREEVLLLEAGMELELGLQLGEQLLPGLHRAVRGLGQLGEQLVRFGGAGLHQGSKVHREFLGLPRSGLRGDLR